MQYTVRIKPGSRQDPSVQTDAEGLIVHVRERAVDGAANAGVMKVLAAHFGVPPRDITIVRGHRSRIKRINVEE